MTWVRWGALSMAGAMAITFSIGEMVAIATLLVTILLAVLGTYVGVIRRLDKQDSLRELQNVKLDRVVADSVEAKLEMKNVRGRLHDLGNIVNGALLEALRVGKDKDRPS